MPRAGANIVIDLPEGLTAIHCPKCGRMGRYRSFNTPVVPRALARVK